MKKSILLFALAVAAALLLAGCGQSQTGAQTPADSTSVSSFIEDTEDASQSSPQFPGNLPDASAQPSETDQSTEETDSSGANSQGQEQPAIRQTQAFLRAEMCLFRLLQMTRPQLSLLHPVPNPSRRPLLFLNRKPGRSQSRKQSRNPPKPPRPAPLSLAQT